MDPQKKLEFLHKIAKLGVEGIPHYDSGGTVLSGPTNPTSGAPVNTQAGGLGGAIGSLLGGNSSFQASAAPIQQGTNGAQLNQAYSGAQSGLQQQQGLTNTLTPGVAQGANVQSQVEQQLLAEGQGKGPNPAQAALNQSTGQNIAQTAALMASQRGAGANAGATAANAAQLGASLQQNAVGQGATLQAQQQLAAQQAAANVGANQISQGQGAVQGVNNAQQGEQGLLQNANTSYNNAAVTQQGNINNANASIAAANAQNASKGAGGLLGGIGTVLGLAKGGMVCMDKGGNVLDAKKRAAIPAHEFALPGRRYPIHDVAHARNALARVAQNGTPAEQSTVRAAVHRRYPDIGKKMAAGGVVAGGVQPISAVGQWLAAPQQTQGVLSQGGGPGLPQDSSDPVGVGLQGLGAGVYARMHPKDSGTSDNMFAGDQGEQTMPDTEMAASGGKVYAAKGEKAVKTGDSYDNDKVPAMLSEGEIVIPRHITQGPDAAAKAAEFVKQALAKRRKS